MTTNDDLMWRIHKVTLWFYQGDTYRTSVVRSVTGEPWGHVALEINDCVYSVSKGRLSGWYLKDSFPTPDVILEIPVDPFPVSRLDSLPVGTKYPYWRTILWWGFLCLPPVPSHCVQSCLSVLEMGNRKLRARTVGELYEKARQLQGSKEILCGPGDCRSTYSAVQQPCGASATGVHG